MGWWLSTQRLRPFWALERNKAACITWVSTRHSPQSSRVHRVYREGLPDTVPLDTGRPQLEAILLDLRPCQVSGLPLLPTAPHQLLSPPVTPQMQRVRAREKCC